MRYGFGDYTLDTQHYELCRAGQIVPLRPKVFHVLAYLLAQRARVVSKDELIAHVWPGQSISDETLSSCLTAARRAVGDSGAHQHAIQTRRGHGYRVVATVALHDHPSQEHVPLASPLPGGLAEPMQERAPLVAGPRLAATLAAGASARAASFPPSWPPHASSSSVP